MLNLRSNKLIWLTALSFLICLVSASFSIGITSAPDSDHHMSSIWCAWGEKQGICENRQDGTAEVPFFEQMCNGVPTPPPNTCGPTQDHSAMQRLRTTTPEATNLFYVLMRSLASHDVQSSIVSMRLVTSLLATLLLFGALKLARGRLLIAAICMMTFTNFKLVIYHFTMATPKSWALLGAMFSWMFLEIALNKESKRNTRLEAMGFYGLSIFLVIATRIDATFFALFSNIVVIGSKFSFYDLKQSKVRSILLIGSGVFVAAMTLRATRIQTYLIGFTPHTDKSVIEYLLFMMGQITETLASCFGYEISQGGAGPYMGGIFGLSMFALVVGSSLQHSNRLQLANISLVSGLFAISVFKGNITIGPNIPGTYVLSIAAMLIGFTVWRANDGPGFMLVRKGRLTVLLFMFLIQFGTGPIKIQPYWGISLNSSFIHWLGQISFLSFLLLSWQFVILKLPENPTAQKTQIAEFQDV